MFLRLCETHRIRCSCSVLVGVEGVVSMLLVLMVVLCWFAFIVSKLATRRFGFSRHPARGSGPGYSFGRFHSDWLIKKQQLQYIYRGLYVLHVFHNHRLAELVAIATAG